MVYTFALGKQHKLKKYYVKLLLFLVDVALTNSWIYYKLSNPGTVKKEESRADFFLMLANVIFRQDIDWCKTYQIKTSTGLNRK